MVTGKGSADRLLCESDVRDLMSEALAKENLAGKRVLVIIPDGTRSGPTDLFFRLYHDLLWDNVAALDYLIALGTHQPMSQEAICQRVGVTQEELDTRYAGVQIFNHQWEDHDSFQTIGNISISEIEDLSDGLLSQTIPVTLNKMIFDYDQLFICGPVFPHEVVGFSGGNKYFFPGISGPEVINFTHWLGALMTSYDIIGTKHTPVRAVIDRAAAFIDVPTLCFCSVATSEGLAGLYIGEPKAAWEAASDLSSQVHIRYVDRTYNRVLSVLPELYDDIWTRVSFE